MDTDKVETPVRQSLLLQSVAISVIRGEILSD